MNRKRRASEMKKELALAQSNHVGSFQTYCGIKRERSVSDQMGGRVSTWDYPNKQLRRVSCSIQSTSGSEQQQTTGQVQVQAYFSVDFPAGTDVRPADRLYFPDGGILEVIVTSQGANEEICRNVEAVRFVNPTISPFVGIPGGQDEEKG